MMMNKIWVVSQSDKLERYFFLSRKNAINHIKRWCDSRCVGLPSFEARKNEFELYSGLESCALGVMRFEDGEILDLTIIEKDE